VLDRRIKLRHLTCFLAVARHRTIGAAAADIGMTQPAASKTIQELEEILGARLFERSKAGSVPTALGRLFQRHAEAGIAALNRGVDSVAQARGAVDEVVRVGALPTVAARLMPAAVDRFLAGEGAATVRVVSGPNTALIADLRVGTLDLVVGRMAEADGMSGLSFEHLYSEQVAFVVRPGHPLLGAGGFDIRRVADYPVLTPAPGSIIHPTVERFLAAEGIGRPPRRIETVSPSFGRVFVAGSDAVWIISRGVVETDVRDGLLALLPIDTRDTFGPVGLTLRAEATPSPAAALFIEAVRSVAADLRAERG
jgi:LysR family pca operon transcriptional activator